MNPLTPNTNRARHMLLALVVLCLCLCVLCVLTGYCLVPVGGVLDLCHELWDVGSEDEAIEVSY